MPKRIKTIPNVMEPEPSLVGISTSVFMLLHSIYEIKARLFSAGLKTEQVRKFRKKSALLSPEILK